MNKIFDDEDSAIQHIKNISCPANALRLHKNTPCVQVGKCVDCQSDDRICSAYVKIARQPLSRMTVLVINEELGFISIENNIETGIQDLKFNPFDEISNHWVLISAKKDGVVNTMTASWGQLGHLWGKNVMTVYIRPQRYTKEFVDAEDYFTVTLFDGYKKELGVLGSKSGRDGDKIAEVSFDIEEVENQPTFKQGKMVFVCKKIYSDMIDPKQFIDSSLDERWYPQKDYHQRYIGEIIAVYENK